MTPEQKTYAMKVAIAGLSGAFGGAILGQFVSEPPTMGKTLVGSFLGAALVGSAYGIYLRTGGEGGEVVMAGMGNPYMRMGPGAAAGSFGVMPRHYTRRIPNRQRLVRGTPGRFRHLGAMGSTVAPGTCIDI